MHSRTLGLGRVSSSWEGSMFLSMANMKGGQYNVLWSIRVKLLVCKGRGERGGEGGRESGGGRVVERKVRRSVRRRLGGI